MQSTTAHSPFASLPAVEPGECAALIAAFPWERTPLGDRATWPQSLRTAVAIMLDSPMSIALMLGREGIMLYNDGYARIAGNRHPGALGVAAALSWPEVAAFNQHIVDTCLNGESLSFRDEHMVLNRFGLPEDAWFDIDYAPLRDEQGTPVGVFATVAETTGKIRAQLDRQQAEDLLRSERAAADDAKERLVTESEFLRAMFERSPSFMAVLRGPEHRFELANEPYLKLMGNTRVVGRTVMEAFPELAGQGFFELLDSVYRTGEPYVGKGMRVALPSGTGDGSLTDRVIDFVYQPMRNLGGEIVGIMAEGTDITDHFMAHERLRVAQEAGGVGTFEWFPDTGKLEASDRYRELWGIAPGAPLDAHVLVEHVHPDDRATAGPLRAQYSSNALEYAEYRITRADTGEMRWLARRGERVAGTGSLPARYFGAAFDITQRKRSEQRAAFLLQLSDRLQNAEGAEDVTVSIAADLGALLNVSRIGYANVNPDGSIVVIEDWSDGTVGRLLESRGVALLGPVLRDALTSGSLVAINDVHEDSHTHGVSEEFARANIRTLVLAPLPDGVRLGSLLYVKGSTPRRWSDEDLGLVHEVAQRMRGANERRKAQLALRESESQFRSLIEAVPHQVWISDPAGGLIWFNSRVYEYTGMQDGELDGDRWTRIVHPDDIESAAAHWRDSIRDGSVYETEFRLKGADGTWRWFLARAVPVRDAQGEIVRWLGTNTDVHAQTTAAAELAQMNEVLEHRVEERTRDRERMWKLSTDLMIVATPDGRILSINPAWTTLLGWGNEQVTGKRLSDFVDPADRDLLERELDALAVAGPPRRFEGRYHHRDGTYRWMAWTAVSDGQFVHAAGRDITGEKDASLALSQAEEALRQSQKMEAVGQLTGGIAHDFNNLLQGITGSLDLVRSRIAQGRTDEVGRFVTSAMASANRATALTHRLLAFSRRQPLSPKTVHINDMVQSLEELLRRTMGERIELDFALGAGLWDTLCDPNQLESSVLNLAINARDAMPDGGRLTVETANVTLDHADPERPPELKPGQYVALTVTDTGTGMPPEVMERAFDPFFTTKPIGQGTGLGLSMIYGFARQSEGGVKMASTVGEGTTVKVYLPRSGEVVREEVPATAPAQAHRAEDNEVVLVIEDEPIVRALVIEVLGDLGYQALEAADGPAGLEILRSQQRIDLLITDIGLPGLNGRQVADGARAVRPDLKVLFMTGYAENAAYSRGFLERGMTMITKPFALDALEERIREMMVGSE